MCQFRSSISTIQPYIWQDLSNLVCALSLTPTIPTEHYRICPIACKQNCQRGWTRRFFSPHCAGSRPYASSVWRPGHPSTFFFLSRNWYLHCYFYLIVSFHKYIYIYISSRNHVDLKNQAVLGLTGEGQFPIYRQFLIFIQITPSHVPELGWHLRSSGGYGCSTHRLGWHSRRRPSWYWRAWINDRGGCLSPALQNDLYQVSKWMQREKERNRQRLWQKERER